MTVMRAVPLLSVYQQISQARRKKQWKLPRPEIFSVQGKEPLQLDELLVVQNGRGA